MLSNDMLCEKHEFDALTVPKIEYGKLLVVHPYRELLL